MNVHSNSLQTQIEDHKARNIAFIFLLYVGTLAPSPNTNVSRIEILGVLVSLTGGVLYLLYNRSRLRYIPRAICLVCLSLAWSLFDLFKESPGTYARNIFGPVMLLFCIIIGTCIRENDWPYVITIFIIICFCGLCRDMCVDLFRINIGIQEAREVPWSSGVRGRALARSMFPLYMAVLSAPLVFLPGGKRRIIGVLLLGMSFWTGTVMGCGRGMTVLIIMCVLFASRTRTQRVALVMIPVILLIILGTGRLSENQYANRFYDRLTNIDETRRNGRLTQYQYAIDVLKDSDFSDFLAGVPDHLVRYRDVNIHNMYLGMSLRYGALCAFFYGIFWLFVTSRAMIVWAKFRDIKLWHLQAVIMAIVFFIYGLVSYHIRWRECVIPGCLIGLLLSITRRNKANFTRV